MNEILNELSAVYQILYSIPVSQDGVQKMATAQMKLRNVFGELEKLNKEKSYKADITEQV